MDLNARNGKCEKCSVCYEMYVALVPKCRRVSPGAELASFTPETVRDLLFPFGFSF